MLSLIVKLQGLFLCMGMEKVQIHSYLDEQRFFIRLHYPFLCRERQYFGGEGVGERIKFTSINWVQ